MRNDRKSKFRRRAVAWSVVLLLLALFFAGMHLLSRVDLSNLHGG